MTTPTPDPAIGPPVSTALIGVHLDLAGLRAVQWLGDNFDEIVNALGFMGISPPEADAPDHLVLLSADGRWVRCPPGHWVVPGVPRDEALTPICFGMISPDRMGAYLAEHSTVRYGTPIADPHPEL